MPDDHIPRQQAPPIDIRAAGEEMLGERWTGPLAYLLGVNQRAVQRWANGQNRASPEVLNLVAELLAIARRARADAERDRVRRAREHGNR